jgi:hypothetical protein
VQGRVDNTQIEKNLDVSTNANIEESEAITADLTELLKRQEAEENAERERIVGDIQGAKLEAGIADMVHKKYAPSAQEAPQVKPSQPAAAAKKFASFELHGETRPTYESRWKRFLRWMLNDPVVVDQNTPGNFIPDPKYRWDRTPKKD